MIRAVLKKSKIQPLDKLPEHWRDGQELIVQGFEPSDDPAEIRRWYKKFLDLSAQIPGRNQRCQDPFQVAKGS